MKSADAKRVHLDALSASVNDYRARRPHEFRQEDLVPSLARVHY
jgi:hypothetical protein